MGFFLRLKLETLSILDSERIDAAILHETIYKAVFMGRLPPSEFPKVKARKSYKRFNSAASAENYMKEPRVDVCVWGERRFWQKISTPMMAKPFAFVLFVPVPPPLICPEECLVRTGESVWEVFRFMDIDE